MIAKQSNYKSESVWQKWAPKCANPKCSAKSLLQTIHRRHDGLIVDGHRYCSSGCFEQAVKRMIKEVINSEGKPAKARNSRVPLGLLLLQRGILTAEQLKIALAQHKSTGLNFGDVLQRLGFATEQQVTAAVAAQWACPVFAVGDRQLENQLHIPRQCLELYRMLPVHYSEHRLLVGFVSSVKYQILSTIGHITSCTVVPCFITGRDYESQLKSPSTSFVRDQEVVFEEVMDPTAMARVVTEHVTKLEAKQLRMGQCRDYFWVRIWRNNEETDLLFRMQHD